MYISVVGEICSRAVLICCILRCLGLSATDHSLEYFILYIFYARRSTGPDVEKDSCALRLDVCFVCVSCG